MRSKITRIENDFTRQKQVKSVSQDQLARRKKRFLYIAGFFMIFAIIFTFQIVRANINKAQINAQIEQKKGTYQRQVAVNNKLKKAVTKLNDQTYVEQLIRDKYFYTKSNETVYSFPDKESKVFE